MLGQPIRSHTRLGLPGSEGQPHLNVEEQAMVCGPVTPVIIFDLLMVYSECEKSGKHSSSM